MSPWPQPRHLLCSLLLLPLLLLPPLHLLTTDPPSWATWSLLKRWRTLPPTEPERNPLCGIGGTAHTHLTAESTNKLVYPNHDLPNDHVTTPHRIGLAAATVTQKADPAVAMTQNWMSCPVTRRNERKGHSRWPRRGGGIQRCCPGPRGGRRV